MYLPKNKEGSRIRLLQYHQPEKVIEGSWDSVNEKWIDHDVEEADMNLGDDIFYTPCQAERYNRKGFNVTDDLILPGIGQDRLSART